MQKKQQTRLQKSIQNKQPQMVSQKAEQKTKRVVRVSQLPTLIQDTSRSRLPSYLPGSSPSIRYRLGKFLGCGGYAQCYQAVEVGSMTEVAIKLIDKNTEEMGKSGSKQRLRNQIVLMNKVNHQNILKLISSFQDQNFFYLVLQLCKNLTLYDLIKQKRIITQLQTKYYIRQLVKAVHHLKQKRILHRDIKPPNILLNDKLIVKLGDFGLAISADSMDCQRYCFCGTPCYMAPEIIERGQKYSYQVDMWSVGVVTFSLLFGSSPFACKKSEETYMKIKQVNYVFPNRKEINVSNHARDFIKRIFILDPKLRLTPQQALSHQFLTESIPSQIPLQSYRKQVPIQKILRFCRNEAPLIPIQHKENSKYIGLTKYVSSDLLKSPKIANPPTKIYNSNDIKKIQKYTFRAVTKKQRIQRKKLQKQEQHKINMLNIEKDRASENYPNQPIKIRYKQLQIFQIKIDSDKAVNQVDLKEIKEKNSNENEQKMEELIHKEQKSDINYNKIIKQSKPELQNRDLYLKYSEEAVLQQRMVFQQPQKQMQRQPQKQRNSQKSQLKFNQKPSRDICLYDQSCDNVAGQQINILGDLKNSKEIIENMNQYNYIQDKYILNKNSPKQRSFNEQKPNNNQQKQQDQQKRSNAMQANHIDQKQEYQESINEKNSQNMLQNLNRYLIHQEIQQNQQQINNKYICQDEQNQQAIQKSLSKQSKIQNQQKLRKKIQKDRRQFKNNKRRNIDLGKNIKNQVKRRQQGNDPCQKLNVQKNIKDWIQSKLKSPYIIQYTDYSNKFGIYISLSNNIRVVLFNDNTSMAMHYNPRQYLHRLGEPKQKQQSKINKIDKAKCRAEARNNRSIVFIKYNNQQQVREDQNIFVNLLLKQGIKWQIQKINKSHQTMFNGVQLVNQGIRTIFNTNLFKKDNSIKQCISEDKKYIVTYFKQNQIPQNMQIMKKYKLLQKYCTRISNKFCFQQTNLQRLTGSSRFQKISSKPKSRGKSNKQQKIIKQEQNEKILQTQNMKTLLKQNYKKEMNTHFEFSINNLVKYASMIKRWAYRQVECIQRLQNIKNDNKNNISQNILINRQKQYIFKTKNYIQISFQQGTKYFALKDNSQNIKSKSNFNFLHDNHQFTGYSSIIIINESEKVKKQLQLPIRQNRKRLILSKKQIEQFQIVQMFLSKLISQRRQRAHKRLSFGITKPYQVQTQDTFIDNYL